MSVERVLFIRIEPVLLPTIKRVLLPTIERVLWQPRGAHAHTRVRLLTVERVLWLPRGVSGGKWCREVEYRTCALTYYKTFFSYLL